MKVLLRKNVAGLGKVGETVEVKDGYAQNFLLPQKLATLLQTTEAKNITAALAGASAQKQAEVEALRTQAKTLSGQIVHFTAKASTPEKLFGSIGATEIAQKLGIDKKYVVLDKPIRTFGEFSVPVRFKQDIETRVTVQIEAE